MAFAAGVVIATALADLLPESTELMGAGNRLLQATAALVGYLGFMAVDSLLHEESWGHQHDATGKMPVQRPLGFVPALGLVAHSTLDGVAIGLGFSTSPELGLLIGLAVLAH